jgi:hypothetical protein
MFMNDAGQGELFAPSLPKAPKRTPRSCERVIKALVRELDSVTAALADAAKVHAHPAGMPGDALEECHYMHACDSATDLLAALRRDWPHLSA